MEDESFESSKILTCVTPWQVYGLGWSFRPDHPFRLGVASFLENSDNVVRVVELDKDACTFNTVKEYSLKYPATKVMWNPDTKGTGDDLIATSSDALRIWRVSGEGSESAPLIHTFSDQKNATVDCCAPLTSFDWNRFEPSMIGTASIDSICTIWDLNAGKPKTRLIAHDKEVFDIAFASDVHVFATVGADGSVRMFDLRSLAHSTILFESPNLVPLLRVAWNMQDSNFLATFQSESNVVSILDIRSPCLPVTELTGHAGPVNGLSWAPHSSCHLITGGEDRNALIWDISSLQKTISTPALAFQADGEVDSISWSYLHNDWVAAAVGEKVQLLRV